MDEQLAIGVLLCVCGVLFVWAMMVNADYRAASKALRAAAYWSKEMRMYSPYARYLGRVVEARVYEGSEWERMVVVAVSWHGGMCVRPCRDMELPGRWIEKTKVPERVREVQR